MRCSELLLFFYDALHIYLRVVAAGTKPGGESEARRVILGRHGAHDDRPGAGDAPARGDGVIITSTSAGSVQLHSQKFSAAAPAPLAFRRLFDSSLD